MPLAPSSMVVVRSPVWSWIRRTITMYCRSNRWQSTSTGIVAGEREQRERHVEEHEDAEDAGDLHEDQHEEDGAEADEAPHHAEVGHRTRQELARLPAVVEAHVEPLELGVEVVAEARLEAGGQHGEQDAPPEGEEHLDQRDGRDEEGPAEDRVAVAVGHRAVDDLLDDQRDGHHPGAGDDRADDDVGDVAAVRGQVRPRVRHSARERSPRAAMRPVCRSGVTDLQSVSAPG